MSKKSKLEKLTNEEIKSLLDEANSLRYVLAKIGYDTNGSGAYQLFKKYCKKNDIEIPKYKPYNLGKYLPIRKNSDVFVENSTYSRNNIKKRIIKEGLIKYKCKKCGNTGEWMEEKLVLQLEHINGIHDDNRLENLCFLCPNCHTQTETYSSKNRKKPSNECKCGKEINKRSKMCNVCNSKKRRKNINESEYNKLLKEIKELGYKGTGRVYKVSDNTIRKWVRNYKKWKDTQVG